MLDASFWEEKSTTAFVKILDARPRTSYHVAVDAKTMSILIVAIDASCGLLMCMSCG
jgi:hypothetical protein